MEATDNDNQGCTSYLDGSISSDDDEVILLSLDDDEEETCNEPSLTNGRSQVPEVVEDSDQELDSDSEEEEEITIIEISDTEIKDEIENSYVVEEDEELSSINPSDLGVIITETELPDDLIGEPVNGIYKCQFCPQKYSTKRRLISHIERHINGGTIRKCRFCDFFTAVTQKLREHEWKHTKEKPYWCDKCSFRCRLKGDLGKHQQIHSAYKRYLCKVCGHRTRCAANLRRHMERHQPDLPRNFPCPICGFAFKRDSALKTHLNRRHNDSKPFSCNQCSFRCKTMWELNSHKAKHSNDHPFQCSWPNCGKAFKTKSDCSKHIKRHSGVKNYECGICRKRFFSTTQLRIHAASHSSVRNFECSECGKRFKTQRTLLSHIKTHEVIKPFNCDVCYKTFATQFNLDMHKRVHEGGRPYQCPICVHGSKEMDHLMAHVGSEHLHNFFYLCCICRKPFGKSFQLQLHLQRCHKEDMEGREETLVYDPDYLGHDFESDASGFFDPATFAKFLASETRKAVINSRSAEASNSVKGEPDQTGSGGGNVSTLSAATQDKTSSLPETIQLPPVVQLARYGGIPFCLARKNSGIQLNCQKKGKKPKRWFMDVSLMTEADAEKHREYLRKKELGLLPRSYWRRNTTKKRGKGKRSTKGPASGSGKARRKYKQRRQSWKVEEEDTDEEEACLLAQKMFCKLENGDSGVGNMAKSQRLSSRSRKPSVVLQNSSLSSAPGNHESASVKKHIGRTTVKKNAKGKECHNSSSSRPNASHYSGSRVANRKQTKTVVKKQQQKKAATKPKKSPAKENVSPKTAQHVSSAKQIHKKNVKKEPGKADNSWALALVGPLPVSHYNADEAALNMQCWLDAVRSSASSGPFVMSKGKRIRSNHKEGKGSDHARDEFFARCLQLQEKMPEEDTVSQSSASTTIQSSSSVSDLLQTGAESGVSNTAVAVIKDCMVEMTDVMRTPDTMSDFRIIDISSAVTDDEDMVRQQATSACAVSAVEDAHEQQQNNRIPVPGNDVNRGGTISNNSLEEGDLAVVSVGETHSGTQKHTVRSNVGSSPDPETSHGKTCSVERHSQDSATINRTDCWHNSCTDLNPSVENTEKKLFPERDSAVCNVDWEQGDASVSQHTLCGQEELAANTCSEQEKGGQTSSTVDRHQKEKSRSAEACSEGNVGTGEGCECRTLLSSEKKIHSENCPAALPSAKKPAKKRILQEYTAERELQSEVFYEEKSLKTNGSSKDISIEGNMSLEMHCSVSTVGSVQTRTDSGNGIEQTHASDCVMIEQRSQNRTRKYRMQENMQLTKCLHVLVSDICQNPLVLDDLHSLGVQKVSLTVQPSSMVFTQKTVKNRAQKIVKSKPSKKSKQTVTTNLPANEKLKDKTSMPKTSKLKTLLPKTSKAKTPAPKKETGRKPKDQTINSKAGGQNVRNTGISGLLLASASVTKQRKSIKLSRKVVGVCGMKSSKKSSSKILGAKGRKLTANKCNKRTSKNSPTMTLKKSHKVTSSKSAKVKVVGKQPSSRAVAQKQNVKTSNRSKTSKKKSVDDITVAENLSQVVERLSEPMEGICSSAVKVESEVLEKNESVSVIETVGEDVAVSVLVNNPEMREIESSFVTSIEMSEPPNLTEENSSVTDSPGKGKIRKSRRSTSKRTDATRSNAVSPKSKHLSTTGLDIPGEVYTNPDIPSEPSTSGYLSPTSSEIIREESMYLPKSVSAEPTMTQPDLSDSETVSSSTSTASSVSPRKSGRQRKVRQPVTHPHSSRVIENLKTLLHNTPDAKLPPGVKKLGILSSCHQTADKRKSSTMEVLTGIDKTSCSVQETPGTETETVAQVIGEPESEVQKDSSMNTTVELSPVVECKGDSSKICDPSLEFDERPDSTVVANGKPSSVVDIRDDCSSSVEPLSTSDDVEKNSRVCTVVSPSSLVKTGQELSIVSNAEPSSVIDTKQKSGIVSDGEAPAVAFKDGCGLIVPAKSAFQNDDGQGSDKVTLADPSSVDDAIVDFKMGTLTEPSSVAESVQHSFVIANTKQPSVAEADKDSSIVDSYEPSSLVNPGTVILSAHMEGPQDDADVAVSEQCPEPSSSGCLGEHPDKCIDSVSVGPCAVSTEVNGHSVENNHLPDATRLGDTSNTENEESASVPSSATAEAEEGISRNITTHKINQTENSAPHEGSKGSRVVTATQRKACSEEVQAEVRKMDSQHLPPENSDQISQLSSDQVSSQGPVTTAMGSRNPVKSAKDVPVSQKQTTDESPERRVSKSNVSISSKDNEPGSVQTKQVRKYRRRKQTQSKTVKRLQKKKIPGEHTGRKIHPGGMKKHDRGSHDTLWAKIKQVQAGFVKTKAKSFQQKAFSATKSAITNKWKNSAFKIVQPSQKSKRKSLLDTDTELPRKKKRFMYVETDTGESPDPPRKKRGRPAGPKIILDRSQANLCFEPPEVQAGFDELNMNIDQNMTALDLDRLHTGMIRSSSSLGEGTSSLLLQPSAAQDSVSLAQNDTQILNIGQTPQLVQSVTVNEATSLPVSNNIGLVPISEAQSVEFASSLVIDDNLVDVKPDLGELSGSTLPDIRPLLDELNLMNGSTTLQLLETDIPQTVDLAANEQSVSHTEVPAPVADSEKTDDARACLLKVLTSHMDASDGQPECHSQSHVISSLSPHARSIHSKSFRGRRKKPKDRSFYMQSRYKSVSMDVEDANRRKSERVKKTRLTDEQIRMAQDSLDSDTEVEEKDVALAGLAAQEEDIESEIEFVSADYSGVDLSAQRLSLEDLRVDTFSFTEFGEEVGIGSISELNMPEEQGEGQMPSFSYNSSEAIGNVLCSGEKLESIGLGLGNQPVNMQPVGTKSSLTGQGYTDLLECKTEGSVSNSRGGTDGVSALQPLIIIKSESSEVHSPIYVSGDNEFKCKIERVERFSTGEKCNCLNHYDSETCCNNPSTNDFSSVKTEWVKTEPVSYVNAGHVSEPEMFAVSVSADQGVLMSADASAQNQQSAFHFIEQPSVSSIHSRLFPSECQTIDNVQVPIDMGSALDPSSSLTIFVKTSDGQSVLFEDDEQTFAAVNDDGANS